MRSSPTRRRRPRPDPTEQMEDSHRRQSVGESGPRRRLVPSSVSVGAVSVPGMSTAPFVLVPGHWLGGWSWDRVTPGLVAAGHRVTAVTLPGLESAESDRSRVRLADHIAALADIVATEGRDTVVVVH